MSARLGTTSPLASICRALGLPRSTLSDQAHPRAAQEVQQAIEAVAPQFPPSGRRLAAQLRRAPYGRLSTRQRAQRVRRRMGLSRRPRPRAQRTTNSPHRFRRVPHLVADRTASEPDETWGSELTSVRLGDEFISLAVLMEVVTRAIRGWQLGRPLGQALTLTALQRALVHHRPVMHHSDPGIQDAAPR